MICRNSLLQENSVFDTTAKSVKKRWNPVIMFNAYRHLQEARKLYIHAKVKPEKTHSMGYTSSSHLV